MLQLKFVPYANWAATPFQGPQIVLIDEQNRQGLWNGTAYALPGSAVASGGASGLSFGSDPTAVGAGGTPYTATGLPWVVAYNGDGSVASYTLALTAADDLVRTVSYTGGFPTYSGNIETPDGVLMTTAQLKALRDEVLAGLGTAARGFRAALDDLAYSVDAAGAITYKRCSLQWDGYQIVAVHGVTRETRQQATHSTGTTISGTLRSLALPAWLLGLTNSMKTAAWASATSSGTGTLRANMLLSGTGQSATDMSVTTSPGASLASVRAEAVITQIDATNQLATVAGQAAAGATGGASTLLATTINTASGDVTVEYCLTLPINATSVGTFRYGSLSLLPPGA